MSSKYIYDPIAYALRLEPIIFEYEAPLQFLTIRPILGLTAGAKNGFFGRTHTEETKDKMRKPKSEETKRRMRKPKSKEHAKNIGNARKNIPWSKEEKETRQSICKHCGITSIKSNITRWHDDNCRHKSN